MMAKTTADVISNKSNGERLLALEMLLNRKERLENAEGATKTKWRAQLTEETQEFHDLIRQTKPSDSEERLERLNDIEGALDKRADSEAKKKAELDVHKKAIASVEATMIEIIRTERDQGEQLNLAGGEVNEIVNWTNDGGREVAEAITDHREQGGELTADMLALEADLAKMGLANVNLALVPDEGEPEAAVEEPEPLFPAGDAEDAGE